MDWHVGAKRLVQQAGISLDDLKPVFQVNTRAAVGHYLNGRRQPRPAQLKRLADRLGVSIDDFFTQDAERSDAFAGRLREFSTRNVERPFGVRYDWSNPGGLDEDTLIHKVLSAGRFEDVLALARRLGVDRLEQAVADDPILAASASLNRVLGNIRRGYEQTRAHAA